MFWWVAGLLIGKKRRQRERDDAARIKEAVRLSRLDTYRSDREDRHTGWKIDH